MFTTYAQRQTTAQKKDAPSASSVLDASSQSESLQCKADLANGAAQRVETPRPNNTGMPDNLKAGIESLSGFSMDDVRVHYNSSKPATVQALAYTQGTDIHVAPGQEKHLPHEAWHVAQQMAGRVSPTTNINGMPVNDNVALEHEADVMGEKAVQCKGKNIKHFSNLNGRDKLINLIQCKTLGVALVENGWTAVADHPKWFVREEGNLSPYYGDFDESVDGLGDKILKFGPHRSTTDTETKLRHDYQSIVSEAPFGGLGYVNYQFQSGSVSHSKVFSIEWPVDISDYRNAHKYSYNSGKHDRMVAVIDNKDVDVVENSSKSKGGSGKKSRGK